MKPLIIALLLFPFLAWGQTDSKIPYFQNDPFVSSPFDFQLSVTNVNMKFGDFLNLQKTPIRNVYDSSVTDTMYTFCTDQTKTKIKIYHSKISDIIESMHIVTDRIRLRKNIRVGMTRPEFEKTFGIKSAADEIDIGDLERNTVFKFSFSKEKLVAIDYSGYLE
ncbi:MAG TPA: hypothetical protein VK543_16120 [Puia sp.]|nr:hypothetical protein [Puia sp.]